MKFKPGDWVRIDPNHMGWTTDSSVGYSGFVEIGEDVVGMVVSYTSSPSRLGPSDFRPYSVWVILKSGVELYRFWDTSLKRIPTPLSETELELFKLACIS